MKTAFHPSFPDYEISEDGTVLRTTMSKRGQNNIQIHGRILKSGYRQFKLVDACGKRRFIRAARLMLEAFIGPAPTSLHEAAHWDGDRLNNSLYNLRWATKNENEMDKLRHGTWIKKGDENHLAKLTYALAARIREEHSGRRGDGIKLARKYGVDYRTISAVICGHRWRHD